MGNKSSKKKQKEVTPPRIKCVLLGSGCVGKSTVFKQIKLIYMDNKPDYDERKAHIRSECVQQLVQLIQILTPTYAYDDEYLINDYIKICIEHVQRFKDSDFSNENENLYVLGETMDTIWKLDIIQQTFEHKMKTKYDYWDNIDFFLNKIKSIMNEEYMPNIEDCLKSRIRTTRGFTEIRYHVKSNQNFEFQLFDVGGRRSERRKWISLFPEQDCVIFVVALNQFCVPMFEDGNTLGLHENIQLWKKIANNRWLHHCKMCLLFNKIDLFQQSLVYNPLTVCFGDEYKGRNYSDCNVTRNKSKVCKKILFELILVDVDSIAISDDLINIVALYCDFQDNYWLDLVCKDGIEFIKKKYLEIKQDTVTFEMSAINTDEVKKSLDDIHTMLINHMLRPLNFTDNTGVIEIAIDTN